MRPPLFDDSRCAACLDEAGIDALILTTAPNVLYATRYRKGGQALAILRRDDPERPNLVIPASDIDFLLEDLTDGIDARAYGTFFRFRADGVELEPREALVEQVNRVSRPDADRYQLAAEALTEAGLDAGSIASDAMLDALTPLRARLPRAHFRHAPELPRQLRMVKTREEVRRLREAARITEDAIEATLAAARPGVTQAELACAFSTAVAAASARVRLANVSVGRGTALGNVNAPDDILVDGDIVRFDVGVVHEGYASDLSRCFAYGSAGERAVRYHAALRAGQEAALAELRRGASASDLFRAAVDTVREAGIPHYDRTNVGHGIGLAGDGYDAPLLAPGDKTVLEEGMVLCVETPYYELGFAGLQVEDMVVVTGDGYEPLTHLPRWLEVFE